MGFMKTRKDGVPENKESHRSSGILVLIRRHSNPLRILPPVFPLARLVSRHKCDPCIAGDASTMFQDWPRRNSRTHLPWNRALYTHSGSVRHGNSLTRVPRSLNASCGVQRWCNSVVPKVSRMLLRKFSHYRIEFVPSLAKERNVRNKPHEEK